LLGILSPAVITIDAPHATRSLLFFWGLTFMAGVMTYYTSKWIRWIIIAVLVGECSLFAWRYFYQFPTYRSTAWPVGLETCLKQNQGKSVIVEAADYDLAADQIYIYPLLYWQIPPSIFLSTAILGQPDIVHMNRVLGFENFHINEYNHESIHIIRAADGSYAIKK
jgi:hypothetical protein